jgi:hypothetical protein
LPQSPGSGPGRQAPPRELEAIGVVEHQESLDRGPGDHDLAQEAGADVGLIEAVGERHLAADDHPRSRRQALHDGIVDRSRGIVDEQMDALVTAAGDLAREVEAGQIYVNEWFAGGNETPFGGFKHSGIGRECGKETLAEYTRTKAVNLALDEPEY